MRSTLTRLLLVLSLITSSSTVLIRGGQPAHAAPNASALAELAAASTFDFTPNPEPRYGAVLDQYRAAQRQPITAVDLTLPGPDHSARSPNGNLSVQDNFNGRPGQTLIWPEDVEWIEWTANVPAAGLYQLRLDYYPVEGKRASIQRGLQINGQYPFQEAKRLVFYRVWREAHPPTVDADGDDVRPPQIEIPRWQSVALTDGDGWYSEPFLFYFTPGPQKIRLISIREPIAIGALHVVSPTIPATYAAVQAQYRQQGLAAASAAPITIQAESPSAKSDPTVRAEISYDPLVQPGTDGHIRLNVFGGGRWRQGGEWVEWNVDVPQEGLYKLGFHLWQQTDNGLPIFRTIAIDGEVPFQEFEEVSIPKGRDWEFFVPRAPDGSPYLVHLTAGRHTLRLTPVIGPIRTALWTIDDTTLDMAQMARQVTLITGPQPDPYRQWRLAERIPDLVTRLGAIASRLDAQAALLEKVSGYRPAAANSLLAAADQMRAIARDPDTLAATLNDFLGTETSLGYWLLSLRDQPVLLDYLWFAPPDAAQPRDHGNVIEYAVATASNFLSSFSRNYISVGTSYVAGKTTGPVLTVWVSRGREWGEIMKEMIEDDFTPTTGVKVNLQVFPPGQLSSGGLNVLLLAAATGKAPDVATGVDPNLPVEFAIRNGVVNLADFPDFQQVAPRFRPGALIPYRYQQGTYALPETQDFTMLFYRTDILDELHLPAPQTWDDVYNDILVLEQNGLDFFYSPVGQISGGGTGNAAGFMPFLFENGGGYYTPDGLRSALDSPQALAAFKQWTGLYTNYKIPLYADFFTRMRTGEMPMGIANYWNYVLFSTAAPELTGRWAMAPLPGVRRPDGTIDRTTGGAGTANVIFRNSPNKEASWQFLKWWMDADTQVRFGTELEALLGVEARWNTANVQALNRLPWPKHDIDAIQEQWKWFRERPAVLGGYFTERHIVNAWNRIVLQGWTPRDAADEAVIEIDRELRRKQEEFGRAPGSS